MFDGNGLPLIASQPQAEAVGANLFGIEPFYIERGAELS